MAPADAARTRTLETTAASVRACTLCLLHSQRTNAVPGEGPLDATVMLIGEAPGRDEDASGRPFVGRAGRILDSALNSAGIPRDSVFITNIVKCRPPGNRKPKRGEIAACRPYLLAQIDAVRPACIVTLGSMALQALFGPGHELRNERGHTLHLGSRTVLATYHPAAILYNRKLEEALRRDLRNVARATSGRRPGRGRGATR